MDPDSIAVTGIHLFVVMKEIIWPWREDEGSYLSSVTTEAIYLILLPVSVDHLIDLQSS